MERRGKIQWFVNESLNTKSKRSKRILVLVISYVGADVVIVKVDIEGYECKVNSIVHYVYILMYDFFFLIKYNRNSKVV